MQTPESNRINLSLPILEKKKNNLVTDFSKLNKVRKNLTLDFNENEYMANSMFNNVGLITLSPMASQFNGNNSGFSTPEKDSNVIFPSVPTTPIKKRSIRNNNFIESVEDYNL